MLAGMLLASALVVTPPPAVQPKLFSALSTQYLGEAQFGVGLGYRFKNNITLIGQGLVGSMNPDPVSFTIRCREYTINPPNDRKWGVGLTVLIPLK